MESIRHLRNVLIKGRKYRFNSGAEFYEAMDKAIEGIEREISERYMELPTDADGTPIRLGDVMDGVGMYDTLRDVTGEVIEVSFNATDSNECVASVALQVWSDDGKSWRRIYIDQYADVYRHHVKPRTIEDVLEEFAHEWNDTHHDDMPALKAKYADELRSMGVSE